MEVAGAMARRISRNWLLASILLFALLQCVVASRNHTNALPGVLESCYDTTKIHLSVPKVHQDNVPSASSPLVPSSSSKDQNAGEFEAFAVTTLLVSFDTPLGLDQVPLADMINTPGSEADTFEAMQGLVRLTCNGRPYVAVESYPSCLPSRLMSHKNGNSDSGSSNADGKSASGSGINNLPACRVLANGMEQNPYSKPTLLPFFPLLHPRQRQLLNERQRDSETMGETFMQDETQTSTFETLASMAQVKAMSKLRDLFGSGNSLVFTILDPVSRESTHLGSISHRLATGQCQLEFPTMDDRDIASTHNLRLQAGEGVPLHGKIPVMKRCGHRNSLSTSIAGIQSFAREAQSMLKPTHHDHSNGQQDKSTSMALTELSGAEYIDTVLHANAHALSVDNGKAKSSGANMDAQTLAMIQVVETMQHSQELQMKQVFEVIVEPLATLGVPLIVTAITDIVRDLSHTVVSIMLKPMLLKAMSGPIINHLGPRALPDDMNAVLAPIDYKGSADTVSQNPEPLADAAMPPSAMQQSEPAPAPTPAEQEAFGGEGGDGASLAQIAEGSSAQFKALAAVSLGKKSKPMAVMGDVALWSRLDSERTGTVTSILWEKEINFALSWTALMHPEQWSVVKSRVDATALASSVETEYESNGVPGTQRDEWMNDKFKLFRKLKDSVIKNHVVKQKGAIKFEDMRKIEGEWNVLPVLLWKRVDPRGSGIATTLDFTNLIKFFLLRIAQVPNANRASALTREYLVCANIEAAAAATKLSEQYHSTTKSSDGVRQVDFLRDPIKLLKAAESAQQRCLKRTLLITVPMAATVPLDLDGTSNNIITKAWNKFAEPGKSIVTMERLVERLSGPATKPKRITWNRLERVQKRGYKDCAAKLAKPRAEVAFSQLRSDPSRGISREEFNANPSLLALLGETIQRTCLLEALALGPPASDKYIFLSFEQYAGTTDTTAGMITVRALREKLFELIDAAARRKSPMDPVSHSRLHRCTRLLIPPSSRLIVNQISRLSNIEIKGKPFLADHFAKGGPRPLAAMFLEAHVAKSDAELSTLEKVLLESDALLNDPDNQERVLNASRSLPPESVRVSDIAGDVSLAESIRSALPLTPEARDALDAELSNTEEVHDSALSAFLELASEVQAQLEDEFGPNTQSEAMLDRDQSFLELQSLVSSSTEGETEASADGQNEAVAETEGQKDPAKQTPEAKYILSKIPPERLKQVLKFAKQKASSYVQKALNAKAEMKKREQAGQMLRSILQARVPQAIRYWQLHRGIKTFDAMIKGISAVCEAKPKIPNTRLELEKQLTGEKVPEPIIPKVFVPPRCPTKPFYSSLETDAVRTARRTKTLEELKALFQVSDTRGTGTLTLEAFILMFTQRVTHLIKNGVVKMPAGETGAALASCFKQSCVKAGTVVFNRYVSSRAAGKVSNKALPTISWSHIEADPDIFVHGTCASLSSCSNVVVPPTLPTPSSKTTPHGLIWDVAVRGASDVSRLNGRSLVLRCERIRLPKTAKSMREIMGISDEDADKPISPVALSRHPSLYFRKGTSLFTGCTLDTYKMRMARKSRWLSYSKKDKYKMVKNEVKDLFTKWVQDWCRKNNPEFVVGKEHLCKCAFEEIPGGVERLMKMLDKDDPAKGFIAVEDYYLSYDGQKPPKGDDGSSWTKDDDDAFVIIYRTLLKTCVASKADIIKDISDSYDEVCCPVSPRTIEQTWSSKLAQKCPEPGWRHIKKCLKPKLHTAALDAVRQLTSTSGSSLIESQTDVSLSLTVDRPTWEKDPQLVRNTYDKLLMKCREDVADLIAQDNDIWDAYRHGKDHILAVDVREEYCRQLGEAQVQTPGPQFAAVAACISRGIEKAVQGVMRFFKGSGSTTRLPLDSNSAGGLTPESIDRCEFERNPLYFAKRAAELSRECGQRVLEDGENAWRMLSPKSEPISLKQLEQVFVNFFDKPETQKRMADRVGSMPAGSSSTPADMRLRLIRQCYTSGIPLTARQVLDKLTGVNSTALEARTEYLPYSAETVKAELGFSGSLTRRDEEMEVLKRYIPGKVPKLTKKHIVGMPYAIDSGAKSLLRRCESVMDSLPTWEKYDRYGGGIVYQDTLQGLFNEMLDMAQWRSQDMPGYEIFASCIQTSIPAGVRKVIEFFSKPLADFVDYKTIGGLPTAKDVLGKDFKVPEKHAPGQYFMPPKHQASDDSRANGMPSITLINWLSHQLGPLEIDIEPRHEWGSCPAPEYPNPMKRPDVLATVIMHVAKHMSHECDAQVGWDWLLREITHSLLDPMLYPAMHHEDLHGRASMKLPFPGDPQGKNSAARKLVIDLAAEKFSQKAVQLLYNALLTSATQYRYAQKVSNGATIHTGSTVPTLLSIREQPMQTSLAATLTLISDEIQDGDVTTLGSGFSATTRCIRSQIPRFSQVVAGALSAMPDCTTSETGEVSETSRQSCRMMRRRVLLHGARALLRDCTKGNPEYIADLDDHLLIPLSQQTNQGMAFEDPFEIPTFKNLNLKVRSLGLALGALHEKAVTGRSAPLDITRLMEINPFLPGALTVSAGEDPMELTFDNIQKSIDSNTVSLSQSSLLPASYNASSTNEDTLSFLQTGVTVTAKARAGKPSIGRMDNDLGPIVQLAGETLAMAASTGLVNNLMGTLGTNLMITTNSTVVRRVARRITKSATVTLTNSLSQGLVAGLSKPMLKFTTRMLTHVLTPAIVYPLTTIIVKSMTHNPREDYYCWFCEKAQRYCVYCRRSIGYDYYVEHYAQYYARFYSYHYSQFYVHTADLDAITGEPDPDYDAIVAKHGG